MSCTILLITSRLKAQQTSFVHQHKFLNKTGKITTKHNVEHRFWRQRTLMRIYHKRRSLLTYPDKNCTKLNFVTYYYIRTLKVRDTMLIYLTNLVQSF